MPLACGALRFDSATREATVAASRSTCRAGKRSFGGVCCAPPAASWSTDVLEGRLYAFDDPVTPNALEAAVSRLRKKLAAARASVQIETKRGIGYRLVAGDPVAGDGA